MGIKDLMPNCHECGYDKTIEETRKYKEEELTVSVCPLCHAFDWETPEGADENEDMFYDSEKWALEQSREILKEKNLYLMDNWSYGEKICLFCDRPAYPTDYFPPDFTKTYKSLVVPLCQYHKATYMSRGLKKLNEMYLNGKLGEERGTLLTEVQISEDDNEDSS